MTPEAKLQKLQDILKLVDESITRQEFIEAFETVIAFVKTTEKTLTARVDSGLVGVDAKLLAAINETQAEARRVLAEARSANETTLASLRRRALESVDALFTRLRLTDRFDEVIASYEAKIGELEGRIQEVPTFEQFKALIPEIEEELAEDLRDKLESLEGDERLDASAIKNLPKGGPSNGPAPALWALPDVEVAGANTNATIQYSPTSNSWNTGVSITVSATAPADPKENDLWIDIS